MYQALLHGFRIGSFEVLPLEGRIAGPSGSESLSPKAMEVLLFLARRAGEPVDYDLLMESVWETPDVDDALDECLNELGTRFGEDSKRSYIEAIPGQGIRLIEAPIPLGNVAKDNVRDATTIIEYLPRFGSGLQGFFDELAQRRVLHAAVLYLIAGWLVIQIAETTFPALHIPDWALSLVVLLTILGFPMVLILAWAVQLTRSGIVIDRSDGSPPAHWNRRYFSIVIGVSLVLGGVLGYRIIGQQSSTDTASIDAGSEPAAQHFSMVPPLKSIAVLPFVNMSKSSDNEYLADGLAEEILNVLARVTDLKVAARTSSFYFRNKDVDIPMVAQHLNVNNVLEGSVRREGRRIRVTAQLIDRQGFHLWSQNYDRPVGDLLDIQDDIAARVVDALQLILSGESRKQLDSAGTRDISAYDFYLQGRSYLRRPGSATLRSAESLFQRALEIDPGYGRAFAGLCDTSLAQYVLTKTTQFFEEAERACHRAVTLDANNADVYMALGNLYTQSGQYDNAEAEFRRILALDPDAVDAYTALAAVYGATDRPEQAEAHYQEAIDLQPDYWSGYNSFGSYLFMRGRYQEAITYYTRVTELAPDSTTGFNNLGAAHYTAGDFEKAAAAWEQSLQLAPTRTSYSNIGTMYFYLGRYADAVQAYRQAIELAPDDHRLWGNLGDALRMLAGQEKAAGQSYEKAKKLAHANVEINRSDATQLSDLARYSLYTGFPEEARSLTADALEIAPADPAVHYSATLVYTGLGELDTALAEAERAVDAGYPAMLLAADPQLEPLFETERFRALVGE